MDRANSILLRVARWDRLGFALMRIAVAVAVAFIWIGWLKFAPYEADGITPSSPTTL